MLAHTSHPPLVVPRRLLVAVAALVLVTMGIGPAMLVPAAADDAGAEVVDDGGRDTGAAETGGEDTGTESTGADDTGTESTGTDDTGGEDTPTDDAGADTETIVTLTAIVLLALLIAAHTREHRS